MKRKVDNAVQIVDMKDNNFLHQRRKTIENQRSKFDDDHEIADTKNISKDIFHSWQRSAKKVKDPSKCAPRDEEYLSSELWKKSPLSIAAQHEKGKMKQLVKEGQLVAAIADPLGRLLWTCASGYMSKRAENLNFAVGGHWSEHEVGTNAVGLSLKLKRPVTVFSTEHYSPFVQDWVCYAAPIIHPSTGECLGTLDISTTWNKHTPLGQGATAQMAQSIAKCLPTLQHRADIEIYAMGQPKVIFRGKTIVIPPRQLEILCLLALNPDGLSLQRLHSAVYGDNPVSTATLKADVSNLRSILEGEIGSRPYRLTTSFWADFIHIWETLNDGNINESMSLYRGALLAKSESPEIEEWRYCIDAVMAQVVSKCESPNQLIQTLSHNTCGTIMERERLIELMSKDRSKPI